MARLLHKTPLVVFSAPAAFAAGLVAYLAIHQTPEPMPLAAIVMVPPMVVEQPSPELPKHEAVVAPEPVPPPVQLPQTVTAEAGAAPSLPEPAAPDAPVVGAAPAEIPHIVIKPGNSLWALSRELYGAGRYYATLLNANRDKIDDPKLIYPGQVLAAPKQMDN